MMPIVSEFVRLFNGRLWHVARPVLAYAGAEESLIAAAFCGESWKVGGNQPPETLTVEIPNGARICTRCVAEVNAYRNQVLEVASTDRRPEIVAWWQTLLDGNVIDDVIDAEIVEDYDDPAELPAPGDDEWPCGRCGHSNLDHDCDDGTCTVTSDDPGTDWGECPCRGLTRAG